MNTIIHTSDWHLGHRLDGQERIPEQQAFLDWLLAELEERKADALLVCGDVFDVANPPIDAVRMLFSFLAHARRVCPNVLLIGGNHDSGARLDAMAALAGELGISIVGGLPDRRSDCIVPLRDQEGGIFARVAAVPYLRPADLAAARPGEENADRSDRIQSSIAAVYRDIIASAEEQVGADELLLVTGHLFVLGGEMGPEGERAERAAHVEAGNLLAVPAGVFGERADYVALGHLHRPQEVGRGRPVVYSGTPIPLSFTEAETPRSIECITSNDGAITKRERVPIPRHTALHDVVGSLDEVLARLDALCAQHPTDGPRAWVRVTVAEERIVERPREAVAAAVADSALHLLAVRCRRAGSGAALEADETVRELSEFSPENVFARLHESRTGEPPPPELVDAFAELLQGVLSGEVDQ